MQTTPITNPTRQRAASDARRAPRVFRRPRSPVGITQLSAGVTNKDRVASRGRPVVCVARMNPFESEMSFEGETFNGLTLEGFDLSKRDLQRCTFKNSKLAETRWSGTRLEDCVFDGCDLTRADFTGLVLRDVTFRSCKLMGIDFSNVGRFPHVAFEDCDLRYVSMVSIALRKTRFDRCNVDEASFVEADLAESKFERCRFAGTRFEACDLRRARFREARDLFLDPARNRLKETQVPLQTAILLATSLGMRVLGFTGPSDGEAD